MIATGMGVAKMKRHMTLGAAVMDHLQGEFPLLITINLCFKKILETC
jgi:hypothetical protein